MSTTMIIRAGDFGSDQLICYHPQTDLMVGLLQKLKDDGRPGKEAWRVELFMKIQATASTKIEAVAFARGAWAAVEAFGLLTTPKGIQDVQTKTVVRDAIKQKIKEMDDDMHTGLDRYTGSDQHLLDEERGKAHPKPAPYRDDEGVVVVPSPARGRRMPSSKDQK